MKVSDEEIMLSVASRTDQPLTWEERITGGKTEYHLVDVHANEHYGFIKDGVFITSNMPCSPEGVYGMTWNPKSIERIYEDSRMGFIHIIYDNKDYQFAEDYSNLESVDLNPEIDFKKPLQSDVKAMLFHHWGPMIRKKFYYEKVSNLILVNLDFLETKDDKKVQPLQGVKNNPIVTKILMELEKETQVRTFNSGTQRVYRFTPTKTAVLDALIELAYDNQFNGFIETIRRIPWDEIPRVDTFLKESGCTAKGVPAETADEYLSAVMWGLLLGLLERNLNPDYKRISFVPIIMGPQGVQKTTLCNILGMDWYRATTASFESPQKFNESIPAGLLIELKESTQFKKDGVEIIKAAVDEDMVSYRKPYASQPETNKILYSLIATTNDESILSDNSGNRRFFPVYMSLDNMEISPAERSEYEILQLWAEALVAYNEGQRWGDRLFTEPIKGKINPGFVAVQMGARAETIEYDAVRDYVDNVCPKTEDLLYTLEMKVYFDEETTLNRDQQKTAYKIFTAHPEEFGFGLVKYDTTMPFRGRKRHTRVYRRDRIPKLWEAA